MIVCKHFKRTYKNKFLKKKMEDLYNQDSQNQIAIFFLYRLKESTKKIYTEILNKKYNLYQIYKKINKQQETKKDVIQHHIL